jgi:hypothetical protein
MLWAEGQRRTARESRERLTELFVGVRDGHVAGEVAVGRATARGDVTPAYARADGPARSAGSQAAALARLAAMFPGAVRGVQ